MDLSTWQSRFVVLALILGWFFIGWFARGLNVTVQGRELALFDQARQLIMQQHCCDAPDQRVLTQAAIQGMVESLSDPYAVYWDPETAPANLPELNGGALMGINGDMRNGVFEVSGVMSGSPAQRAGLEIGDVILAIDGWRVPARASHMDVVSRLHGLDGSKGQLSVRRGQRTLTLQVGREQPEYIVAHTIGSDIVYLRLDRFMSETPGLVENALRPLLTGSIRGLIWDLRYNQGGSMNATQGVLDFFEPKGVAFYGRTRDGKMVSFPTKDGDFAEQVPIAVLIGPDTYSAPETAAPSLADPHRATLIGEKTHGKGMFDTTVSLQDGSVLRISVAQSLSPVTQTCYEGKGVPPQIVVRPDASNTADTVLAFAVNHLRSQ